MTTADFQHLTRLPRGGGRSVDTDSLRSLRLNLDLNAAERAQINASAAAAAMPLRRWARRTLLGATITPALSSELRQIWSSSSTLQSNFNQLCSNLNQMDQTGELSLATCEPALLELARLAPGLHQLVRSMRLELTMMRGAS